MKNFLIDRKKSKVKKAKGKAKAKNLFPET